MRALAVASTLLALLGGSSANPLLGGRAVCNADNCARAVTGTRAGAPSTRLGDCSSFQRVVVYPATVTSTQTYYAGTVAVVTSATGTFTVYGATTVTTVTRPGTVVVARSTTFPPGGGDLKRGELAVRTAGGGASTVSPTRVPGYASACSPSSRYASACSCAGVSKSTLTLATPTAYATVTARGGTSTRFVEATATIRYNVTAEDRTAVPAVTVSALPCNARINPHVGRGDTYLVNCDVTAYRHINFVANSNATTEYECLLDCARQERCDFARFTPRAEYCQLYSGDGENPGFFGYDGIDIIQRISRGTGTGTGYARPTGTIYVARRVY